MLTPEEIKAVPDNIVLLYEQLEEFIIKDIARRLLKTGKITETAKYQFEISKEVGLSQKDIEKEVSRITNIALEDVEKLLYDANLKSYNQQAELYNLVGKDVSGFQSPNFRQIINSAIDNTQGELINFTQSLGMAGTPLKQFYSQTLDLAHIQVSSGVIDYNTAIKQAINKFTLNGLQVINYESGHWNNLEVAVRRAIMTGVSQSTNKVTESNVNDLGVELVEVSAHSGARPSHQAWQGKIYGYNGIVENYPDFVTSTGYGDILGLGGVNCRHSFFPFFKGVSKPTYTNEQLKNINKPDFEYNGKTYTEYDATQKQRQLETKARQIKREIIASKAIGDKEQTRLLNSKKRRYIAIYNDFSDKANLKRQPERRVLT